MTNMENIERPISDTEGTSRFRPQDNRQNLIQMRTSTTNRFLTNSVRTLCCVAALTACSAWATVATWQPNSSASSNAPGATSDSSQSAYASTARGFENTNAVQYQSLASNDRLSFAANTNTPTRSATELDEAMAKSFGADFVSVPTVQFAATGAVGATGAGDVSMASMTSGPGSRSGSGNERALSHCRFDCSGFVHADSSPPPCGAAECISHLRLVVFLFVWFETAVFARRRPFCVQTRRDLGGLAAEAVRARCPADYWTVSDALATNAFSSGRRLAWAAKARYSRALSFWPAAARNTP